MITQNQIPPMTKPNKKYRGWTTGTPQFGHQVRQKRRTRSRARQWPSTPTVTKPWMFPCDSNRAFMRWIRYNWNYTLTQAERDEWIALAPTLTLQNYKHISKTLTGYQLYQYYETCWKTYFYLIGKAFDPSTAAPDTGPYTPWTPPATPSALNPWHYTWGGIILDFTSTPSLTNPGCSAMFATPYRNQRLVFTKRIVDVNAICWENPLGSGTYQAIIQWGGILPTPPPPGTYTYRLRILDTAAPFTPSEYAEATVTLPF